jgi:hypothetical protein
VGGTARLNQPADGRVVLVFAKINGGVFERALLNVRLGASVSSHPMHALNYAQKVAIHRKWMDFQGLRKNRSDQDEQAS